MGRAGPQVPGLFELKKEGAGAGAAEASSAWGWVVVAVHAAEDVAGWPNAPLPWEVAGSL